MASEDRVRLNPQTLRGISHPLRVRLLNLLREDGPSTATRLAERTGQSTGATSYHLRQLAAYGFVIEDGALGAGRERWWRAAHEGTTLERDEVKAAPALAEAYLRAVAIHYSERMSRWLAELPMLPAGWDHAATLSDWRLRLRPDEAARLLADIEALLGSYRRDDVAVAAPDGAERVVVQLQLMPFVQVARGGRARAADQADRSDPADETHPR
ncbi:MAG TPA: helix-turn-helix domain-containing protein [Micromonosporaceae bacterium]